MSDDQSGEPAPADATPTPQAVSTPTPDAAATDAGIDARARKQAAERRVKIGELEAELEKAKAREAKILAAAGVSTDGDQVPIDDAVKAAEAKAAEMNAKAERALLKARFTAVAAGSMDPAQIEDAFILAEAKNMLGEVVVDLENGTVTGMTDALKGVTSTMPHLTKQAAPAVNNLHAGDSKGSHIDLQNVKPGDMTRFKDEHPDEYRAMLEEGITIPLSTFGTDADGNYAREKVTMKTGQDSAIARIDKIVANANKR